MELPAVRNEVEQLFQKVRYISVTNDHELAENKIILEDLKSKIDFLKTEMEKETDKIKKGSIESTIYLARAAHTNIFNVAEQYETEKEKDAYDKNILLRTQEANRKRMNELNAKAAPAPDPKLAERKEVVQEKKKMGRPKKEVLAA